MRRERKSRLAQDPGAEGVTVQDPDVGCAFELGRIWYADLTHPKQFVDLQAYVGDSIRAPHPDASPETWAEFRAKLQDKVPGLVEMNVEDDDAVTHTMRALGMPEEAGGYSMPEIENAENLQAVAGFNEWAHEARLTQRQFETLAKRFSESELKRAEESAASHNEGMEALQREWGFAYEQKRGAAITAAKVLGAPDDFTEALADNKVPAPWVKFMAGISERLGKEADVGALRDGQKREMTPAEAEEEHSRIMNDRTHPFWSAPAGSKEKARAMALVQKLKTRAMGPESRAPAATFGYYDVE